VLQNTKEEILKIVGNQKVVTAFEKKCPTRKKFIQVWMQWLYCMMRCVD